MAHINDFELMIVRHGMAEQWHERGDEGRELTEAGVKKLERAVPTWRTLGWGWSAALCSPYSRARRTAEIFRQGVLFEEGASDPLPEPLIDEDLVPHGDAHTALHHLLELGRGLAGPRPRVAVFSHNPMVSRLASLLVCGDEQGQFSFGQGDMLHLFIPAPSHLDTILAPQKREPAPRAVVLGFYPSDVQVAMCEGLPRL